MRTDQETFDLVVQHLYEQEGPARNQYHECVYRNSDGKKCAIGCLIPDGAYKEDIESLGVVQVWEDFPELRQYLPENCLLARELQDIHDTCPRDADDLYRGDLLYRRLSEVAKNHHLNSDILRQFA